ncbi:MAG: 50S ribosomal protein L22 [Candidatus Diapherotrites archaeon]
MVKKKIQNKAIATKKSAVAVLKNKPVSLKYVLEIIRTVKGKRVDKAIAFLNRVISLEEHLPLRVYNKKVPHKKGEAKSYVKSGRYPVRAAKAFIELLELAKANANNKGLDADNLIIVHAFASQGFRRIAYQPMGRIAGKRRKRKSCHMEVVVKEAK